MFAASLLNISHIMYEKNTHKTLSNFKYIVRMMVI